MAEGGTPPHTLAPTLGAVPKGVVLGNHSTVGL